MAVTTAPAEHTTIPGLRTRLALAGTITLIYVLSALTLVVNAISGLSTICGRTLLTFNGADGRLSVADLPQLLQAEPRAGVVIYLSDLPLSLRWLCASPALIEGLTIAAAGYLTARIVLAIATGRPFTSRVRRHLTVLSAVLLIGGSLQGLMDTWAGQVLFTIDDVVPDFFTAYSGLSIDVPHWPMILLVLGLVAAALRLAFTEGARLQAEMADVV